MLIAGVRGFEGRARRVMTGVEGFVRLVVLLFEQNSGVIVEVDADLAVRAIVERMPIRLTHTEYRSRFRRLLRPRGAAHF